jgi:hypothetical protein
MRDPVLASDGHVYERASIVEWLQMNCSSPVTGEPLQDETALILTPVHLLKRMIQDYEEQQRASKGGARHRRKS